MGRCDWPRIFFAAIGIRQFTVSENVVECCSEPDVAVIVAVNVTGCRVLGEAPAQPLSWLRPTAQTASSTTIRTRCRFFQPRQKSANPRADTGRGG